MSKKKNKSSGNYSYTGGTVVKTKAKGGDKNAQFFVISFESNKMIGVVKQGDEFSIRVFSVESYKGRLTRANGLSVADICNKWGCSKKLAEEAFRRSTDTSHLRKRSGAGESDRLPRSSSRFSGVYRGGAPGWKPGKPKKQLSGSSH